jgi:hypothetical protein
LLTAEKALNILATSKDTEAPDIFQRLRELDLTAGK